MGHDLIEKFIRDSLMFWATIDPVGTLSIFAGLASGMTGRERQRIARAPRGVWARGQEPSCPYPSRA